MSRSVALEGIHPLRLRQDPATSKPRSGNCELQDMASDFGIRDIPYEERVERIEPDRSTPSIVLNPEKCVFGIPARKLLGFIVSNRGIEANSAKIRALSQLASPTDLKQIQKLTG